MTPPSSSPAVAAQRRVLEAILATGCASPALAAAAEKGGDPFDALKSLPVVGYTDSYAAAARGCVDALRDGDVSAARAHLSHLLATVATSTTDASHVLAFFMTSGTSGNAAKLFPLTVAAQNARSSYYRVMAARSKATLAGVDGARLALATPGVPQELPCLVEGEEGVEVGGEVATHHLTAPTSPPADTPWARSARAPAPRATLVGPATAVLLGPVLQRVAADAAAGGAAPPLDADIMGAATLAYPVRVLTAFDAPVAAKHYMMWFCALARGGGRVTQLTDFFGGSILSAVSVLRDHGASMAADLRAGALASAFPGAPFGGALDDSVRDAVNAYVGGAQPAAAAALEAALASDAPLLGTLFPRLSFISAIFTGAMRKYAPRVAALVPPTATLATDFYGGSEGCYGLAAALLRPGTMAGDDSSFVLAPGVDVVFEFLEVGKEQDPPVLMQAVTANTLYEIVVTTFGGLARYRVGDVVRVMGTARVDAVALAAGDAALASDLADFDGAPIIEFVGRAGSQLNLVWEKYDEGALVGALSGRATAPPPWSEFALREEPAPPGGGLPHYIVYVEPPSGGSLNPTTTATAVEAALRAGNDVYALLVARGQIAPSVTALLRCGAFGALRDAAVARGTSVAQYKAPIVLEGSADGLRASVLEEWVVERARAGV